MQCEMWAAGGAIRTLSDQIIFTDAEDKPSEARGDGQTSQVLDPCR